MDKITQQMLSGMNEALDRKGVRKNIHIAPKTETLRRARIIEVKLLENSGGVKVYKCVVLDNHNRTDFVTWAAAYPVNNDLQVEESIWLKWENQDPIPFIMSGSGAGSGSQLVFVAELGVAT